MIDRDTVTTQLMNAGVIEEDGCGLFLAAGLSSEVIDATLAIAQKAAEAEREACARINSEKSERLAQEAEQAAEEGDRDTCTSNRAAAHLLSVCAARIRARSKGGQG